jgi:hypothetical protein
VTSYRSGHARRHAMCRSVQEAGEHEWSGGGGGGVVR